MPVVQRAEQGGGKAAHGLGSRHPGAHDLGAADPNAVIAIRPSSPYDPSAPSDSNIVLTALNRTVGSTLFETGTSETFKPTALFGTFHPSGVVYGLLNNTNRINWHHFVDPAFGTASGVAYDALQYETDVNKNDSIARYVLE